MNKPTAHWEVLVVGGGPAGMLAAARAAETGCRTLLIEKNPELGRKLLLSGGGRCNVTTGITDRHQLASRYGEGGRYLHSIFARFGAEDTRALLRRFGLETREEAEQRVFPVTDSARSVRDVLEAYLEETGVVVQRDRRVTEVEPGSDGHPMIRTNRNELLSAGTLILAAGGASRPDTGSDGTGFRWLQALGVPVRIPEPSLVPLRVSDRWVQRLQGLALSDAGLHVESLGPADGTPIPPVTDRRAWGNARRVLSRRGKLLFTHFGLSGPLALNAATAVSGHAGRERIRLSVDPLPGWTPDALGERLNARGAEARRSLRRALEELLPQKLVPELCRLAGLEPTTRLADLPRDARRSITGLMKGLPMRFSGLMGEDRAVVSSGGVSPDAIDFKTMRLRALPSIAVVGDLIDVNRQSGGFSLQLCWASAWVAGSSCRP
mgnify:FL=1